MKTREIIVHQELAIDVDVVRSAAGEPEIKRISSVGIELNGEYMVISEFENDQGDTIADLLMERHVQALERAVEEEDRRFQESMSAEV